jgi:hypothetical protein
MLPSQSGFGRAIYHRIAEAASHPGARGPASQAGTRAASGLRPAGHYGPPARSWLTTGPRIARRKRGPTPEEERRGGAPRGAPASVIGRWSPRGLARPQGGPNGAALPYRRLSALRLPLSRRHGRKACPAPCKKNGAAERWRFFTSPACGGGRERSEAGGGSASQDGMASLTGPLPASASGGGEEEAGERRRRLAGDAELKTC